MGNKQIDQLLEILQKNKTLQKVLEQSGELGMSNWYVGAGSIAQTVWNIKHGFESETGIKDYDLVYFDDADISYEAEDKFIQSGKILFGGITNNIEIRNQARVHLWYEQRFGTAIKPYRSTEEAIQGWPTTVTAIGVTKNKGQIKVYAPFGLDDLLNLVIRPNKVLVKKDVYQLKVERWQQIWPKLQIIPWD